MAKVIQRRRGTSAEHSTFAGALAEITIDTTKDTVVVHDGSTVGGHPLAREDLVNTKTTSLPTITGAGTEATDTFLVYDSSAGLMKSITRAELNNAIERDSLSSITLELGSASAPTLSFLNDANTGIWSSGADTINISTGGTERVRIDASGNIGVGTTTPGSKLAVNGTITESTDGTNYYPVVTQQDIGTAPNEVPLNQYLGSMAYQNTESVNIVSGQINTIVNNPILSSGTPNGVAYLNGSKVLTTGSALTFDGTTLSAARMLSTQGIFTNANTITANQTIAATDNAGSYGPMSINSGVVVTVSSGSVWTII